LSEVFFLSEGGSGLMSQPGAKPRLEDRVIECLKRYGYQVSEKAKLKGNSGLEHSFDLMARRDDDFTSHTMAIDAIDEEKDALSRVFSLMSKAEDAGIGDRAVITSNGLGSETDKFARQHRIRVFDPEQIKVMLSSGLAQPATLGRILSFETKAQLLALLDSLGYRVRENERLRGRSGVEYVFDMVAYIGEGEVERSLAVDIITTQGEIGLGQVVLFDSKANDAGVNHKAVVVLAPLSAEAKQFARHQQIKTLEPEPKPLSEFLGAPPQPEAKSARAKLSPQPEALQLIPEVMARKYNAIPLAVSSMTLTVAMVDPTDIFALQAFSARSQMRIKPVAASAQDIGNAIDVNYKGYGEIEQQIAGISVLSGPSDDRPSIDVAADAPLAKVLDLIIDEAVKARSSDIHIEPEENRTRIRYRIDGTLQDMISLPSHIHSALVSRIKILADMNIADHHRPQDGQFSTTAKGRAIDIRVATSPAVNGEMAVLRLLDKSLTLIELSELGLLPHSLARYEDMLKAAYGMILVSGPTGAGKTTTLYASINSLDRVGQNIITIEDPAEYRLKNINQIQVSSQAGVTFAKGLRSILRLDPDVIMVGEIRDAETANIAVQAALTGHLMLSSIHASDATGVIFRLLDLEVEPFLVASAVLGIVAQRMVRRICPDCSRLIQVPAVEQMAYRQEMGERRAEFLYGSGCKSCSYTGYRGRTGIFEILTMSDEIRTMVTHNASSADMRGQALKDDMTTMMNDGMQKVKAGVTTPSEVLRVTHSPV